MLTLSVSTQDVTLYCPINCWGCLSVHFIKKIKITDFCVPEHEEKTDFCVPEHKEKTGWAVSNFGGVL